LLDDTSPKKRQPFKKSASKKTTPATTDKDKEITPVKSSRAKAIEKQLIKDMKTNEKAASTDEDELNNSQSMKCDSIDKDLTKQEKKVTPKKSSSKATPSGPKSKEKESP